MKIVVLSILIIGIGAILFASKLKSEPTKSKIESKINLKITAEEFVKTIDSLGYFKYTDKENIEKLKKNQIEISTSSARSNSKPIIQISIFE